MGIMSYQDTLDKKKSIQAARKELDDFSDLIKLHSDYPEIQAIKYGGILGISSCLNYDQKQLHKISKKDEQLKFVNKVLNAMMKLEDEEIQIVYSKYVQLNSDEKIAKSLNMSLITLHRKLNRAYFDLSIALNVEVPAL